MKHIAVFYAAHISQPLRAYAAAISLIVLLATPAASAAQNAHGDRRVAALYGAPAASEEEPTSARSDGQTPKTDAPNSAKSFEYAVKFVCGKPEAPVVAPGEYFTAINVHNPSYRPVGFRKKVAVALPGEKPGPISEFFEAHLNPDQALEIDCPD